MSAGYSHYFQYQVSDINGDVQSVDISRISSEAELYPTEKITFSGMIAGWFGQQDYRCIEGIGSCSYEGKNWSYTLEAGVSRATYMFNFVEQKIFSWDVYFEGARYLSDTFSIDGSYSLIFAGMDGMEDIYKHLFRGGFSLVPVENVFLFSGVTLSIDTTEFINFGFDIGGSTYIFRYVKLSFSYMLSYGNSFTADSNVSLPGPSPGTTSETERYFSHRIFSGLRLSIGDRSFADIIKKNNTARRYHRLYQNPFPGRGISPGQAPQKFPPLGLQTIVPRQVF